MTTSVGSGRAREAQTSLAYVLHNHPYRETSLIVELFTRSHGRLGVMAKGARRPRSELRGTLMAFQPMQVSWSGKGELKVLHRAEWEAGHLQLEGSSLICGFYLNELLLKLLPREDPHEALFEAYVQATHALRGRRHAARVLRQFECVLLRELGYALNFHTDIAGRAVQPQTRYEYLMERGPRQVPEEASGEGIVHGSTLLTLNAWSDAQEASEAADERVDQESRALMRQAIGHYLNGQELRTRQLLRELQGAMND